MYLTEGIFELIFLVRDLENSKDADNTLCLTKQGLMDLPSFCSLSRQVIT